MKRIFLLLLISVVSLSSISVYGKKVILDFSDSNLTVSSNNLSCKVGDIEFKLFKVELRSSVKDIKLSTADSYIKCMDNCYIRTVIFYFNQIKSGNRKITYSYIPENNTDFTDNLELYSYECDESWSSIVSANTQQIKFKSSNGSNMFLSKIVVYYDADITTAEDVASSIEFNNNANDAQYKFTNNLIVNSVESEMVTNVDEEGNEVEEKINLIYAADKDGGICIKIPDSVVGEDFPLPSKYQTLTDLTGTLNVEYNVNDTFRRSPFMEWTEENPVSFTIDSSAGTSNVVTEIDLASIMTDNNVNREFSLSTLSVTYVENIPYYTSGGESPILIPIEDKFDVLKNTTLARTTSSSNFILGKNEPTEVDDQYVGSKFVAYPVSSGTPTSINDILIDVAEEEIYYNLQGVKVNSPEEKGIYIVRKGQKVEKVIVK